MTAGLDRALERGSITMRGYDRVLRIAWTLADLDDADRPGEDQVGARPRAAAGDRAMSMFGLKEAEVATLVRAVAGEDLDRDEIETAFARAAWSGSSSPATGTPGVTDRSARGVRGPLRHRDQRGCRTLSARGAFRQTACSPALARWQPKVSSAGALLALRARRCPLRRKAPDPGTGELAAAGSGDLGPTRQWCSGREGAKMPTARWPRRCRSSAPRARDRLRRACRPGSSPAVSPTGASRWSPAAPYGIDGDWRTGAAIAQRLTIALPGRRSRPVLPGRPRDLADLDRAAGHA